MTEDPKAEIPQTWDPTLEKLLQTPLDGEVKKYTFNWTNQTMNNFSNAPTFIAAINGERTRKTALPTPKKGVMSKKEEMIRKMILKPLSPRKPDVIPGSKLMVKQRDKFALEMVIQQRNRRAAFSTLSPLPDLPDTDTQRSTVSNHPVRPFTIPSKNQIRPF